MEKGMVVGSGLAQKFQRAHKNDPTYKECKTYAAKNLFKKDWLARKLNEARIGRVHTRRYQRVDAKKGVYLLFPAVSALFFPFAHFLYQLVVAVFPFRTC